MNDTYLAIVRIIAFTIVSYPSLIITEVVLDAKPLPLTTRALLCVINSLVSTYLLIQTTFQITYLISLALLLLEFIIVYRKSVIKLICVIEAYILSLMCLRGITVAIFALAFGANINDITGDTTLLLITTLIPNIVELLIVITILRFISMLDMQLLFKYTVQRRYILFWLTVYNLFMIIAAEVYNPNSGLSFAVIEHLCIYVFVLLSSFTMPFYTIKLNRAVEIQKKNKSLSLELGNQKQLQSALMHGALFMAEANLTQNKILTGLDIYTDSLSHLNSSYDGWFNFVKEIIHPDDYGVFCKYLARQNLLDDFYQGIEPIPFEYRRIGNDGNYHWIRLITRIFSDVESDDVYVFGYTFDIDEEMQEKQELMLRAQTDHFTGLFHKLATESLIEEEIKKGSGILIILDVDNFKNVNDRLGHEVGDHVLKHVAEVLKNCSRDNDILGRIGGDEFMVFLKDTRKIAVAEQRAAEILTQLKTKVEFNHEYHSITVSMGIAIIDDAVKDFSEAYNRADNALYQVKRSEKNGYAIYGELNDVGVSD